MQVLMIIILHGLIYKDYKLSSNFIQCSVYLDTLNLECTYPSCENAENGIRINKHRIHINFIIFVSFRSYL